jgi:DNA-binding SARP family transcriptional activator/TolB-like protein/Flp pilus assembly protein TadD
MALLAFLAIARPHGFHRRDKLLALFWPELDISHARNSLSQALHVLRSALSDDAILTRGDDEVRIASGAVRSDVAEFEAALDANRPEDALLLYRGDLLDGFFVSSAPEFERWLDAERIRLRQRASEGGWTLARINSQRGDAPEAERHARWAASLLLPDETQLRQLMNFLHGLGDRSAAVRAYDDFARRFAEEYELEPSTESQALATTIRNDVGRSPSGREIKPRVEMAPFAPNAAPEQDRRTTHLLPRSWGRKALALVLLVSLAGITASFGLKTSGAASASNEPRVPRLVVLPLKNLGSPENAYFAEGIGDEITTRLATIRGLNVIGGAAAQRYKTVQSVDQSLPHTIPADYFLEGTASWLPSAQGRGHVRVRLQLVDARDGAELWGAVVEEDIKAMTELIALYSGVAQRVVNELDVVLETPRRVPAVTIPTTSLEAYNDYLRGRDYLRRTSTAVNFSAAIQSLEHAVERDTSFALAFALLSNAHSEAVWQGGMGREHLDQARIAAQHALRLDPNLPEGHTYLGFYYYACCEDYEGAMWHLTKSNALRPGDWQVVMFMGNVHKRQGRWDESIKYYEEAAQLDPLARWPKNNLGHAQMWARKYDDAERTFRRVLSSEPQDIFAYAHLAWLLVLRDGDTKAARRIVDEAARSSDGFAEMRIPYYLALLDRKYDEALATLTPPEPGLTASLLNEWLVDDEIRRALVFRLRGDSASARAQFDSARAELEIALRGQSPESRRSVLWLRGGLAIAYAGLGRRADATQQINFVMGSNPLKVDAIEGPKYLQHVALADVLLGNRSAAIDVLEQLLSVGAPVSSQSLRLEPFWDPLRSEPRFVRMVGARQ